jgi:hypothetical protein
LVHRAGSYLLNHFLNTLVTTKMSGIERLRAIRAKYATDTTQSQSQSQSQLNDTDGPRGRTRKRASDIVENEASPATKGSTTHETRKQATKPASDKAEIPHTTKESTSDATLRKPKQHPDEQPSDTRTFQDLVQEYGNDGE